MIGSVAASLGVLALSIPFRREAAAYGNSFFSALILLVALGVRLAAEPGSDAPVRVLGNLIRAKLRRGVPTPPPDPHIGPSRRRRRPSLDRARRRR